MPNEYEKLWDYDVVAIGQTGTKTTVTITTDTLREYAQATQHARGLELSAPRHSALVRLGIFTPTARIAYNVNRTVLSAFGPVESLIFRVLKSREWLNSDNTQCPPGWTTGPEFSICIMVTQAANA